VYRKRGIEENVKITLYNELFVFMGKDNGPSNIFEAAGRMGRKQKPEPSSEKVEGTSSEGALLPAEDLETRFARCKSYYSQIKKKIEAAFDEEHISPVAVDRYLETPTNFAERQWQEIEKTKRENTKKLKALLPEKAQKPPEEPPEEAGPKREKPKPDRPKSGFISKKKWIPMR